jgi:predicted nuclease of predicted toxin-antitoxin system
MRFLVDNQFPPALARFIQNQLSANATHVVDLGMQETSDQDVWTYASVHNLILISEADFTHLAQQKPTAKLIWL